MPEPGYVVDRCRSCQAPVIWAVTETKLRSMPVDAQPVADGNIQLIPREDGAPWARALKVADRFGKTGLRVAHFATCPNADKHRRAGKGRRP